MTTPITYPPGPISQWGINEALLNQSTWISYIGIDGSIWYLTGPLAPIAGAQNGMVVKKFMGLMANADMIDQKGARQDGATWQAAVYDPAEIMLGLELSGLSPQETRDTMRAWISAWDFRTAGTLSVFTPDMGEWWCSVRQAKNITDEFSKNYTWSGRQAFTWSAKNYDAFWHGIDSTCSFAASYNFVQELFFNEGNASTLDSSKWTQIVSPTGHGTYGVQYGAARFIPAGTATPVSALNISKTQTNTANQVVSVKLAPPTAYNLFNFVDPGASFTVYARLNAAGSQYAVLSVGLASFSLTIKNASGSATVLTVPILVPPATNDLWTLIAGTAASPYQYVIQRNGFTVADYTDSANRSNLGNKYMGFGVQTNAIAGNAIIPPPIQAFSGADNNTVTQSGWINLTNFGDQPAWPRYLCYGPGTFSFNNGPGSGNMISFGPLLPGQVVLVTTHPQYRSVVDLSPGQPPQQLNVFQQFFKQLISFATNNNVPPLLQQFESLLGIQAPQGNLYSLLSGRFTVPIPPASYGVQPPTEHIYVTVSGGNAQTNLVASITPMRKWPL